MRKNNLNQTFANKTFLHLKVGGPIASSPHSGTCERGNNSLTTNVTKRILVSLNKHFIQTFDVFEFSGEGYKQDKLEYEDWTHIHKNVAVLQLSAEFTRLTRRSTCMYFLEDLRHNGMRDTNFSIPTNVGVSVRDGGGGAVFGAAAAGSWMAWAGGPRGRPRGLRLELFSWLRAWACAWVW